jgi:uncharacterized protein involved in exopolysaccharide biosynthesis
MPQEFSPKDQILYSLRYWWIITLFIFLGGLIGYAIHHMRPPIYEAKATIYTYIDYTLITDVLLTEYDKDITINTFKTILLSNNVVEGVLMQASDDGIAIDYPTFIKRMTINRELSDFDLYYRDENAEVAQKIVNSWVGIGLRTFNQLKAEEKLPIYLFANLGSSAELPQKPTYSQTNNYVLSGAVIGLMFGIVLTAKPGFLGVNRTAVTRRKTKKAV